MEEEIVCRTCLQSCPSSLATQLNQTDNSDQISLREKLLTCVPELTVDIVNEPRVCQDCSAAIALAYQFKSICVENEKILYRFIKYRKQNVYDLLTTADLLRLTRKDIIEEHSYSSVQKFSPNDYSNVSDYTSGDDENVKLRLPSDIQTSLGSYVKQTYASTNDSVKEEPIKKSVKSKGERKQVKNTKIDSGQFDDLGPLENDVLEINRSINKATKGSKGLKTKRKRDTKPSTKRSPAKRIKLKERKHVKSKTLAVVQPLSYETELVKCQILKQLEELAQDAQKKRQSPSKYSIKKKLARSCTSTPKTNTKGKASMKRTKLKKEIGERLKIENPENDRTKVLQESPECSESSDENYSVDCTDLITDLLETLGEPADLDENKPSETTQKINNRSKSDVQSISETDEENMVKTNNPKTSSPNKNIQKADKINKNDLQSTNEVSEGIEDNKLQTNNSRNSSPSKNTQKANKINKTEVQSTSEVSEGIEDNKLQTNNSRNSSPSKNTQKANKINKTEVQSTSEVSEGIEDNKLQTNNSRNSSPSKNTQKANKINKTEVQSTSEVSETDEYNKLKENHLKTSSPSKNTKHTNKKPAPEIANPNEEDEHKITSESKPKIVSETKTVRWSSSLDKMDDLKGKTSTIDKKRSMCETSAGSMDNKPKDNTHQASSPSDKVRLKSSVNKSKPEAIENDKMKNRTSLDDEIYDASSSNKNTKRKGRSSTIKYKVPTSDKNTKLKNKISSENNIEDNDESKKMNENIRPKRSSANKFKVGNTKTKVNKSVNVKAESSSMTEMDQLENIAVEQLKVMYDSVRMGGNYTDTLNESAINETSAYNNENRRFVCTKCNKSYNFKSHFDVHLKSHIFKKLFSCPVCEKDFSQEKYLQSHAMLHTAQAGSYQCHICLKYLSASTALKRHYRTHTGEKPYICPCCDKQFAQKIQLNVHMRTHTGQKPFKCDICHAEFSQKSHLLGHVRIHTGEKPYKCAQCPKRFRKSYALRIHQHSHSIKPFQCKACNFLFKDAGVFERHVNKHLVSIVTTGSHILKKRRAISTAVDELEQDVKDINMGISLSEQINKNDTFDCQVCGKQFSTKFSMKRHMRGHSDD